MSTWEELDHLAETAQKFLSTRSPLSRALACVSGEVEPGYDRALWRDEAGLGWAGIAIPETLGGSGLGFEALGRLLEVCGRYLAPEPFLSTLCLATPSLLAAESRARPILEGIAAGDVTATAAVPDVRVLVRGQSTVTGERDGGAWRLKGQVPFVLDANSADWIVLPVSTVEGIAWLSLPAGEGYARVDGTTIDGRCASRLSFDGASVSGDAVLAMPGSDDAISASLQNVAPALVSSWLLGIAEEAFERTLEHLRTRVQFGVPLGSFQALQHRMASLYCDLCVARAVVEASLQALDSGSDDAGLLSSAAKARTGALAMRVTGEAIQLHGGMGMTEEAGIGIYYKAARVADLLVGSHSFHQRIAATRRGIDSPYANHGGDAS